MNAHVLSTLAVAPAWLTFAISEVELDGIDRLVVPHDASIIRVSHGTRLTLRLRRHLALFVSPPSSLERVPESMGCAERRVDRTLRLATFGVWSTTEGAASMRLQLEVPEGLEIVRARNRPSAQPLPGWTPVTDAPDPNWADHWPDDAEAPTHQPGDYRHEPRYDFFFEDL